MFFFQCKFKPFYKYAKSFNSDDFDYDGLESSNYIFMRWKVSCFFKKETFLIHLSSFKLPVIIPLFVLLLSGAVPGPRSHHQRHQRRLLCWFLLHLFPEVHRQH